jgi:hypothetical protein
MIKINHRRRDAAILSVIFSYQASESEERASERASASVSGAGRLHLAQAREPVTGR